MDIYDDGIYSVHALTNGAAQGLLNGEMQKKVAGVFNENISYEVITAEEESRQEIEEKNRIHLLQKKYSREKYSIRRLSR